MIRAQLYGDISCPLTYLLIKNLQGLTPSVDFEIDWIGIERFPELPLCGRPFSTKEHTKLEQLIKSLQQHSHTKKLQTISLLPHFLPNTRAAHLVLIKKFLQNSAKSQLFLVNSLMSAYFEHKVDLSDATQLAELIRSWGEGETDRFIKEIFKNLSDQSEPGFIIKEHNKHRRLMKALRIKIIPTLIMADYTLEGPQPEEVLREVFEHCERRFKD